MVVRVSNKRSQRRSPGHARPSVFGAGLPERLRSTSLALLGLTAAAGLGLVAFALQQDWPVARDLPIPGVSSGSGSALGQATIAKAPTPKGAGAGRHPSSGASRLEPTDSGQAKPRDSLLAAAHRVVSPPPPAAIKNPVSPADKRPGGGAPPESQSTNPPPALAPPSAPSSTATDAPTPSPAPAVDGSSENDHDESSNESEAKGRAWGHSKGRGKHKAASPRADEEIPEPSPPGDEEEPDAADEAVVGEPDADQTQATAEQSHGRRHGRWRQDD
jgi:hypothetical protein